MRSWPQYGHLRTFTSAGYSGRSRHGLRDLLGLETARTMARLPARRQRQPGPRVGR
jgi:hypothetical protein